MTEAKVALRFEQARDELDKVDVQVHGAKTHIIQDLAKDLEELLPVPTIAEEITTRLKGKVGKTLVYRSLDAKYKNVQRVKAQKKPKKKDVSSQVNLEESKPIISIANDGIEEITIANSEPVSEPYSAGAKKDRHASEGERKDALIADLKSKIFTEHTLNQQLQDKIASMKAGGYNDDVTQELLEAQIRIKELEQPFTYKLRVDIGRHRPLAEVRVRPAMKEVVSITFPEEELPSEVFA